MTSDAGGGGGREQMAEEVECGKRTWKASERGGQPGGQGPGPESQLGGQAVGHSGGWHRPGRGALSLALTNRKEMSVANSMERTVPPCGILRLNRDTACHRAAQSSGRGGALPVGLGTRCVAGPHRADPHSPWDLLPSGSRMDRWFS